MFPDLKLAVAEIWLRSSQEEGVSRGLEGWIKVFNSPLRLTLHMGSLKSCAVPWQGARLVFHFKLKLFKEAYECWGRFYFFGFVLNPGFGPNVEGVAT